MLKRIALIASGVVVVGVVGMVTIGATHGASLGEYLRSAVTNAANGAVQPGPQNFDMTKTVNAASVTRVQVNAQDATVHVTEGPSSNEIVAHAYGSIRGMNPDDFSFVVKQNGGLLTVTLNKKSGFVFGGTIHLQVDVTVPHKVYQQVDASVSAGKVNVENLSAQSFTLHSSAGSVSATGLTGTLRATSSAGSVNATDITGDVRLDSSAGTVNATNVDGNLDVHNSAGTIDIVVPTLKHNITANASAGTVLITVGGVPEGVSFDLHSGVGTVKFSIPGAQFITSDRSHVQGSIGSGGPTLQAESSAGSVEVVEGH